MDLQVRLGNPLLIFLNSCALLLIGCAIGAHWKYAFHHAVGVVLLGSAVMIVHDWLTGVVYFWAAARWTRMILDERRSAEKQK